MRKWFLGILCLSLALSCRKPPPIGTPTHFVDYGNGVYYFPLENGDTTDVVGRTLSNWLVQNPCHVHALAGDAKGPYGHHNGYFIICVQPSSTELEKP